MERVTTVEVAELTAEQQDRRRRLIDAAFELGADGGYDAVQMRDVAVTANVALATIYRYFSSKDHLLAAAMTEWTGRLKGRVAQSPPRGDTAADQMVDVLHRACKAMERQPKLSVALVRALSSADAGVAESSTAVQEQIAEMGNDILVGLPADVRADISLVGSVEKIRDELGAWEDAGVTMLVVGARDVDELRRTADVILG
jgi:AcrR family transcriptional regulator